MWILKVDGCAYAWILTVEKAYRGQAEGAAVHARVRHVVHHSVGRVTADAHVRGAARRARFSPEPSGWSALGGTAV